jgi:hypothetical protein
VLRESPAYLRSLPRFLCVNIAWRCLLMPKHCR